MNSMLALGSRLTTLGNPGSASGGRRRVPERHWKPLQRFGTPVEVLGRPWTCSGRVGHLRQAMEGPCKVHEHLGTLSGSLVVQGTTSPSGTSTTPSDNTLLQTIAAVLDHAFTRGLSSATQRLATQRGESRPRAETSADLPRRAETPARRSPYN